MPWIRVDGDINGKYAPVMVWSSEEATRLSEANAQQVAESSFISFPEYAWRPVRIMGFDECIVEGTAKKK
jgi:hypothetical protein